MLQDFNSDCSDISQLDLKLEYAQDQLRIQNHHLFNQYLHQLLANNQLGDLINQFEASFVEKADTNKGLTSKEEVDVISAVVVAYLEFDKVVILVLDEYQVVVVSAVAYSDNRDGH